MRPTVQLSGSVIDGASVRKPLTVLQVLPALDGGGVERGTLEVAMALRQHGHRSLVISGAGHYLHRLEATGSQHFRWPIGRKSPLTLRWIGPLRRLLQEEQVDILHARSRLPAWVAWLAWRGLPPGRRPGFVTTVHGLYSVSRYSAVMTRGEQVIAVSGYARDYIRSNYPDTDPGRIVVIPRGVDPDRYPAQYFPAEAWLQDWYRDYPQTRERYLLTLPGRLTRRKGVQDFIAVIERLHRTGIPVHGLLAGAIPGGRKAAFIHACRRDLERRGLADVITFTGYRDDLREVMALSDVVLSLSLQPEAYGRTVSEALSLSRPVAAYAHGGVGEQLGALFPQGCIEPGDVTTMAELLTHWYTSPPRMAAVRPPTLAAMQARTLELYAALAARSPGVACE